MLKKKAFMGAAAGYLFGLVTSLFVPEIISLFFPLIGLGVGRMMDKFESARIREVLPDEVEEELASLKKRSAKKRGTSPADAKPVNVRTNRMADTQFAEVEEYLYILEDMVLSEGQKQKLDEEIVDRCLSLFLRIHHLLPLLDQMENGDLNHMVRRLVLKDLNGFIAPYLRLSRETKIKNRQTLLNGLKDIHMKITSITERIEYKDLIELQTKADLIHQRYSESEGY
ncbi:hypothetical protein [Tumebacillus flagellatus]|uniref:5-bromo-4-chloroindolyl phosphate hydrolysis protein n=1 Tax=Tumebacillus flagellatus TaxID=1157490 RepID=A0A074MEQ2_9BACL|nr:hypothetical protein [Tumebacillus flagellatus]KEO84272.1 hypothetical protein EL26_05765 [Tumebacillus flagellatus]